MVLESESRKVSGYGRSAPSGNETAVLLWSTGSVGELDCAFEAICENCSFFQTSIEFRPTLQAQHDDADAKGQHHRADLFNQLLAGLTEGEAS
jgi:hypothetical protein